MYCEGISQEGWLEGFVYKWERFTALRVLGEDLEEEILKQVY